MPKGQGQKTVHAVMKDFKAGSLHTGSKHGPIVTNRKQAIAIAMHESGLSKGNFEPLGSDYDPHNAINDEVQDDNDSVPEVPPHGSFTGSRSGWKRGDNKI